MFGFSPRESQHLFTLFGFPVAANLGAALLLVLVLFFFGSGGPQQMTMAVFLVLSIFFGVLFHELGHAIAVKRLGYGTSQILFTGLGGLTMWRGAPTPKHTIWIAAAGPIASLVLAGASYGAWSLVGALSWELALVRQFLWVFMILNLIWGVFNLLPVYPMDGGKILRAALRRRLGAHEATRRSLIVSATLGVALLVWSAISGQMFIGIVIAFLLLQNWNEWSSLQRR